MKSVLRWVLRGVVVLGVLVALAAALGVYLVSRSLPDPNATVTVEGLEKPVSIIRDAYAVPHIRAESAHDAFFALGLVHAQDRLWQMELNRRAAQGRLSAILGERTVAHDRLVKTLDLYGYAMRALEHQTPETRAALTAYAEGVNAWIRHIDRAAIGRGAPEFFVFGEGRLAPWTEADSLAILKMMALRLSGAARSEVRRGRFLLSLPPDRVQDILPDYPGPASNTPARFAELFPGARFAEAAPEARDPILDVFGPPANPELAGASNAWAVDGSRSATGKPLLASDPHLWLSAPSLWYLADIEGGSIAAIGGSLPGTPAILIGRNRALGWGLTTTAADDQDIFIERVNPEDPRLYLSSEGWKPFRTRRIRIDLADAEPIVETVRETEDGRPVLTEDAFGVDAITPENHVATLKWTALEDRDRTMSAIVGLMRSGTVDDVLDASSLALAPVQNVIFSDGEEVGMVVAGALPERRPDSPSQGRIPSPGWVPETDWLGIRPFSQNPRILSPASGAVANANNRVTDAPYPDHITYDWDAPYRIRRLEKELSARDFHSRDSFVALQNDAVSEMARSVLPLVARDLWWRRQSEPVEATPAAERRDLALRLLADWSGDMERHGPEALIFSEWMRQLTLRLAADELGPLVSEVDGLRPLFVERVFRDIGGAAIWCDVDKTPEAETCEQMAELAFDDAMARLVRDYGSNIDGWRWGAAHLAEQKHTPLGFLGPLGVLFSVTHETSGGDYTLLRGSSPGRGEEPFRNVHAAGLRVVYDFADLDRSVMVISTGQSGHPLSRHYDDLGDLWARGDVIPMSMSDDDALAGGLGTMTLRPSK